MSFMARTRFSFITVPGSRFERLAGLRLQDAQGPADPDVIVEFFIFGRRQLAAPILGRQAIHAGAVGRAKRQPQQCTCAASPDSDGPSGSITRRKIAISLVGASGIFGTVRSSGYS